MEFGVPRVAGVPVPASADDDYVTYVDLLGDRPGDEQVIEGLGGFPRRRERRCHCGGKGKTYGECEDVLDDAAYGVDDLVQRPGHPLGDRMAGLAGARSGA